MLTKSQIEMHIAQGRDDVRLLTATVEASHAFEAQAKEARSIGDYDRYDSLRAEESLCDRKIRELRQNLAQIISQLRAYAVEAEGEYRAELAAASRTPSLPPLPDAPSSVRLEDYDPYFDSLSQAVFKTTEALAQFRLAELEPICVEIRSNLNRLASMGETLPAVAEFLEQGTFTDLPLAKARLALQNDLAAVRRHIEESEAERARLENAAILSQARDQARRLLGSESVPDGASTLLILAFSAEVEDRKLFWSIAPRFILYGVQDDRESVMRAVERLVAEFLVAASPDEALDLLLLSGRAAPIVDTWLASHPPKLPDDVTDHLAVVSRLRDLKAYLPESTARMLLILQKEGVYEIGSIAKWLSAPGQSSPEVIEVFAAQLERQGYWREAYVAWAALGDSSREAAAFLIALAADQSIAPIDLNTWWEVVNSKPVYASDLTKAAAAIYGAMLGIRLTDQQFNEAVRSLAESILTCPALNRALIAAAKTIPHSLLDMMAEVSDLTREHRQLTRKIDEWLSTVRSPGGAPARNFYRDHLLPRIREDYAKRGVTALRNFDADYLRCELDEYGQKEINPGAISHILGYLQELEGLAGQLREIDSRGIDRSPTYEQLLKDLGDERRQVSELPGESRQWVYKAALALVSNSLPPELQITRYSADDVNALLFRDNPLVEGMEITDAAMIFESATLALANQDRFHEWRLEVALARRDFPKAFEYVSEAPSALGGILTTKLELAEGYFRDELRGKLALVREYLETLEQDTRVADISRSLHSIEEALLGRDLRTADARISMATEECEKHEKVQVEMRKRAAEEMAASAARAFRRLATEKTGGELAQLVAAAALRASSSTVTIEHYARALDEALKGAHIDSSLFVNSIQIRPELVDIQPEPITEHEPFDLNRLGLLIKRDIEASLSSRLNDIRSRPVPGESAHIDNDRLSIAKARFAEQKKSGVDWEAPLIAYLEERAGEAQRSRDLLRSSEYRYAAIQVANCGVARLQEGWSAVRRNAFSYVRLRLQLQRSAFGDSGHEQITTPGDNWVSLVRSFMLRGIEEFTEVFGKLLAASPRIGKEALQLALLEFPSLAVSLVQTLADRIASLSDGELELLKVGVAASWKDGTEIAGALAATANELGRYPAATQEERHTTIFASARKSLHEANCPDQIKTALLRAIDRVETRDAAVSDPGTVEATAQSITREIYLDAFTVARGNSLNAHASATEVPVHFRVKIAPPKALLRDVEVSFQCDHPSLEIVGNDESGRCRIDIPKLDGQQPTELACAVRLKDGVEGSDSAEIPLEIGLEIGVRRGGALKAVPLRRGKTTRIAVRQTYPHTDSLNPFQVGPAVSAPEIIKGRDEETKEILRALRGKYAENVPLVWGARRIGKSTLLYRIKMDVEIRKHYVPVICDMEDLATEDRPTPVFLSEMAKAISRQLTGELAGRVPVPSISNADDSLVVFADYLDALATACGKRKLLLMLDEMEFFLRRIAEDRGKSHKEGLHEDVVHELRHSMQHKQNLCFLLSGTRELLEMSGKAGERLFQLPIPIHIKELSEKATEALMTEPVESLFAYSTPARKLLYKVTNGHPYFVQAICRALFDIITSMKLPVCSVSELNLAIDNVLQSGGTVFDSQYGALGESTIRRATGRAIASLDAEEKSSTPDAIVSRIELLEARTYSVEDVHKALAELERLEVLTENDGAFAFRAPLMAMYVRTRKSRYAWQT